VLLAFGGAGPIHAAGIARALGISHVVVPPGPGVFSAYGLLRSEVEHHAARTILADTADIDIDAVQGIIDDMFDELIQRALVEGFERDAISVKASVDLRYRGQSSEITVPFESCKISHEAIRVAEARFEEEFEKEFAHRGEVKRFELAAFRLVLSIARSSADDMSTTYPPAPTHNKQARDVYFGPEVGWCRTPILLRTQLDEISCGPVIVEEYDTTIVIPPGVTARLDAYGNIVLRLEAE
jgi:N-methylhydantoinase A